MNEQIENVVVETLEGTVEDTKNEVAEAVIDEAASNGSIAGMVVAGAMTVFAGIGAFATGKWIKNKIKCAVDKHKAKKLAKEAPKAVEQQPMEKEEYLTVDDLMAQQQDDEEE